MKLVIKYQVGIDERIVKMTVVQSWNIQGFGFDLIHRRI